MHPAWYLLKVSTSFYSYGWNSNRPFDITGSSFNDDAELFSIGYFTCVAAL